MRELAGDDNGDVIGAVARQPEDGSAIERQTASGASIGLIRDTRDNAIDAPRSAGDRRRRGWTRGAPGPVRFPGPFQKITRRPSCAVRESLATVGIRN
jgi:hypothetical protein